MSTIANGAWNTQRINELQRYPQTVDEFRPQPVSMWIGNGMV